MLSSPPATPPAQTVPQQRAVVADAPEGKAFPYPHLVPTRASCQSWKRGTENGEGAPAERGCRPVRRCCDSWMLEGSRQQENKNTSCFTWDCQAQGYCEPPVIKQSGDSYQNTCTWVRRSIAWGSLPCEFTWALSTPCHLLSLFLGQSFKYIYIYLFILFLGSEGLGCCVWACPSCGKRGLRSVLGQEHLTAGGFSSRRAQVLVPGGSAAAVPGLYLAAPWHMGSSWIRDRTGVPCIARQILHHWTTRKPWDNHF